MACSYCKNLWTVLMKELKRQKMTLADLINRLGFELRGNECLCHKTRERIEDILGPIFKA